jgi:uncharacterized membrane protein
VYGYDAVGSFKRDDYGCMGSGQNFIMPILDNVVQLIFFHYCYFCYYYTSNFYNFMSNIFLYFGSVHKIET